jgi:hypothetical protein
MIKHHTKNKGDLGVLKAKLDLFNKGYLILCPETEHAPFDIVVYKDNYFKRIQVKYRELKNGKLQVRFSTSWADKNGSHSKKIDKAQIDLYCLYCPDTDNCYYFEPKKFKETITLRVETPKNNQKAKVNLANEYLQIP